MEDKGIPKINFTVEKYASQADYEKGQPQEVIEGSNLMLTSGINELLKLAANKSSNHFDNTNSRIGVGDDKTTAPDASQTDLQAATNKTYKALEATYPMDPSGGAMQFKSVFGEGDANYEWGEFVVKNNTSSICLNRSTNGGAGYGTKASPAVWTITATITIS